MLAIDSRAKSSELIHSLDLEDVLAVLARHYTGESESEEGYRDVWAKLQTMQPKATTFVVVLSKSRNTEPDDQDWVDVSGRDAGTDTMYAIEFTDWAQWLSMPIEVAPELRPMLEAEQLAHCLHEMTFAGYEESDIEEKLEEIRDAAEEVMNMSEEEIKSLPTFPSSRLQ
jgi:hypothetical protein